MVDPVACIEERIHVLEDDQRLWQHQLEDAVLEGLRITSLGARCKAAEDEARARIREDSQELDRLREDLRGIIPGQR